MEKLVREIVCDNKGVCKLNPPHHLPPENPDEIDQRPLDIIEQVGKGKKGISAKENCKLLELDQDYSGKKCVCNHFGYKQLKKLHGCRGWSRP